MGELGGEVIALLLGALGMLSLMWLRKSFAPRGETASIVQALQAQINPLPMLVQHVTADQEAHKKQGEQLAALQTDVAWIKGRDTRRDVLLNRLLRQQAMIWERMGGTVTRRPAPTAAPN